MILNYDCFRDVLLYIEEQDNMKLNGDFKRIMLKDIKDHFSGKYTEEDVQYCVKNLFDGRFLEGSYSIDDNYKYENCKIILENTASFVPDMCRFFCHIRVGIVR